MPDTIILDFRCPYPTIDDDSPDAVRGFGLAGNREHLAAPPTHDGVKSPFAGMMVSNGRCDMTDTWEATGYIIEQPLSDGGFETVILVRDNQGSCPLCGNTGELASKLPKSLKDAVVKLS